MVVIYIGAIVAGAYIELGVIYRFLDLLLATIIIPNMIGLVLLSGEVKTLKDEFFGNPDYFK